MALNLVCVLDFAGFAKGSQISDPPTAAAYWSTRPWSFVQIQDTAVAPTWQPRTGPMSGNLIFNAINEDGNSLLIASNLNDADYIYRSTDRGATWPALTNFGARKWLAGAQSSNGQVIAAVINGSSVYVSTDGGATVSTVAVSGASQLSQIAMSGGGGKILVADNGQGKFWLSTNGGVSFSLILSVGESTTGHVAISRDGGTQIINYNAGTPALLVLTDNFGSSTNVLPNSDSAGNTTVVNANGRVIYTAANGGRIWRTVNFGADWDEITTPHQMGFGGVSDDGGTFILTDLNSSFTYLSRNFGATLASQSIGALSSSGALLSGDKSLALISSFDGTIYTLELT